MLSGLLLSAPKKFGYCSVLSVESLYPFLSSSHSCHPTLALWVFLNAAAKIASCPLLSLHYLISRSIDLNKETMVYSMCQNTTLFTKREPISANFLHSIEAIWEDSYTVTACTFPCGSNSGGVVFARMLLAGQKSSNMFDTRWTLPIISWNTASKTLGRKEKMKLGSTNYYRNGL